MIRIFLAVVAIALAVGLSFSVGAVTLTLDAGINRVVCPPAHRAYAAYTLNRDGLNVECRALTPTETPVMPTATPTPTPIPTGVSPFCTSVTPLGAIPPAIPEWCFLPQHPEVATHINGANSWADDWQHGASHARLGNVGDGYVTGGVSGGCATLHFRHAQHWMVDIRSQSGQYPALCGAWLRPERTFTLTGGRLVVEMEVAVPIAGTRGSDALGDSWPELVISTAPRSTTAAENWWGSALRRNGTYLYEAFPRAWTFGCRMQQSRHPICALYNDGEGHAGGPDRQWEVNQNGGEVRFQQGGDPSIGNLNAAWKSCSSVDDPDIICRNVFRFEFYKDETGNHVLDIYSNGTLYYRAGLIDAQLDNIFTRPFYVYFGEFAYRLSDATVVRFHWDHIAVDQP
jgi:hypothetical protein